jgi:hypothetical protein
VTVSELILLLSGYPQDMEVRVAEQSYYGENDSKPAVDVYVEEWDDGEIIQNVVIVGDYR